MSIRPQMKSYSFDSIAILAIFCHSLVTNYAHALPGGGQVVSGTALFSQSGNVLSVTNSNGAVINWNTFNIAAGETTRFLQASSSSSVLNRVLAADPSVIYGTLSSNGKVWLINPYGIMIGPGARIDTAGFIASALPVTNADFLAGRLNFGSTTLPSQGSVSNQGTITTPQGGSVYLIGASSVENGGLIQTPGGSTLLAAGQTVRLVDTGIPGVSAEITGNGTSTNLGALLADAGRIGILGAVVKNSGTVNASSVVKDGGRIYLKATNQLTLTDTSNLQANSATGNGGFIETSAESVKIADGARVSTLAPHGLTGTWLVDPTDYTVAASGGDITGTALSTNLGSTNVTLQSGLGATAGSGNVNINDTVSWSANTILTLTATNNVNVNKTITATGTSAGIAINPNTANAAQAASGTGTFNLNNGAQINLPNVSPNSTTAFVLSGQSYTVINSLGAANSISGRDLQGIQGNLSANYVLGSNINAVATSSWNGSAGFMPIAPSVDANGVPTGYAFAGILDGLGHTVSNLTINRPTMNDVGLFGTTGSGAVVRNIGMSGGSVNGLSSVGGLVGQNGGKISNANSNAMVSGTTIGGLVGYNFGGSIVSSYAAGNVAGTFAGGLVGQNTGNISDSHATGTITGAFTLGGLVGQNFGSISNSYSSGNVNGSGGGLIGYNAGTIDNSFYDIDLVSINGSHQVTIGGIYDAQYQDWLTHGLTLNIASYATLPTGAGGAHEISSLQGLKDMLGFAEDPTYTFRLTTNIDLSNAPGFYAPYFAGTFDGGNFIISNLTISSGSNIGMFGLLLGSVENISLNNVNSSGSFNVGALVGWNKGQVTNASATGYVSGSSVSDFVYSAVGGLVGKNDSSASITSSFASVDVSGYTAVGGLVGFNAGAVADSHATGEVNANHYVGGLIGLNHGNISNAYATGDVGVSSFTSFNGLNGVFVGGLVGYNDGWIDGGHATGAVRMTAVPDFEPCCVGGLVGENDGLVTNSYAESDIQVGAGSVSIGGLVGYNRGEINNSHASGSVDQTGRNGAAYSISDVGGLVGSNEGIIGNSYSTTNVNGSGTVGGLVGSNSGTLSNSFYDYDLVVINGTHKLVTGGIFDTQYQDWISHGGILNVSNYSSLQVGPGGYYTVSSIQGLKDMLGFAEDPNFGFRLGNDINLSTAPGFFVPYIAGDFDGANHVISNLNLNEGSTSNLGFIGTLFGSIKNLSVVNANVVGNSNVGALVGANLGGGLIDSSNASGSVSGRSSVGGLVGTSNGTISNSSAAVTVSGNTSIGGLIGYMGGGEADNSHADGMVSGFGSTGSAIGGLVGLSSYGTISGSYATGRVSSNFSDTGGLVGANFFGHIVDSYASGNVVNAGGFSPTNFGGLVGLNGSSSISNSYANGNVNGGTTTYKVGGLVGISMGTSTITATYATGNVAAGGQVGGLVGDNETNSSITQSFSSGVVTGNNPLSTGGFVGSNLGTVSNSYWDMSENPSLLGGAIGVTGLANLQMFAQTSYAGFDFTSTWWMIEGNTRPFLRMEYSSSIANPHQLQMMALDLSASYKLASNIDMSELKNPSGMWNVGHWTINSGIPITVITDAGFIPIGSDSAPFAGSFDGQNYTIDQLSISRNTNYVGLFGVTAASASVANVEVTNANITGASWTGGLVGLNRGSITDVSVTGTIQSGRATSATGGLVGENMGSIVGARSAANLYGDSGVGGLVGLNETTISDSYATGAVQTIALGFGNGIGGLAGTNGGTISNSYAAGAVLGITNVGGLVGDQEYGLVDDSHATGNVAGTGISGFYGGLVGQDTGGTIQNSYAIGNVSAGGGPIGGLLGQGRLNTILNSYATGSVTATQGGAAGGLVGFLVGGTLLTTSYETGQVNSPGNQVGALVGYSISTPISSSYWNSSVNPGLPGIGSGQTLPGVSGLTSSEMLFASNFVGFNFTTTPGASGNNWVMVDEDGSLNNAGGATGAVFPMLSSEYSTTITNAHQLQLMAMDVTANYTLGSNINAAGTSSGADVWSSSGFVPVGNDASRFSGNFNGLGHTINNLKMNRPSVTDVGLFGYVSSSGTITNVGLIGGSAIGAGRIGGLVGLNAGTVTNSFNTGNVSGSAGAIGGLVGYNYGRVDDAYASGNVSGGVEVGGLVGYNFGTINNSYATGSVSGTNSYVGGLAGFNTGAVTNSYWNTTTSGQGTSAGGTGLTTAQMHQQASYAGFDFINTWRIYEGHTAPLLKSFLTPLTVTADNVTKVYDGTSVGLSNAVYSDPAAAGSANLFGISTPYGAVTKNNVGVYQADFWSNQQGYDITSVTGGQLTVTPATLTITATGNNKVYDGTVAASVNFGDNRILGDDLSESGTVTFADKNIGTGKTITVNGITLTGTDAGNYSFNTTTTATANLTARALTVAATGNTKVYDGTIAASVNFGDNRILGDVLSESGSATFADKNVGTGKTITVNGITLTGTDAGNYSFNTTTTATANITARVLTVTATGGTKVYDTTTTAPVALADNRILGDVFSENGTATFAGKNVGTGKGITVNGITLTGTDADNYSFNTTATTTGNITQKSLSLSGTPLATNKIYDGTTLDAITGAALVGVLGSDNVLLGGNFGGKNVGNGKAVSLALTGTGAGNYSIAPVSGLTANVTARALAITATGINKVYDGTTAASVTFGDNRVLGDVLNESASTTTFGGKNANTNKLITVSGISLGGTDARNYTFNTTTTATANVTPKALSLTGTLQATNKVYDGTLIDPLTGATLNGILSGDSVLLAGSFADKNVGTAKAVSVALAGTGASNYSLAPVNGLTADITLRPLIVTATGGSKVYDGTTTAPITFGDNRILGDVLSESGSANFGGKNVGTGKGITVNGITLTGTDAGNYSPNTTATTTGNVTARALAITATGINKVYDGTTAASVTFGDNRVLGDVLNESASSTTFGGKNANTNKLITVSGISLGGTDARNYTFNTTTTATANVTPRSLVVTADNQSIVVTAAIPPLTYTVGGLGLGMGDTLATVFSGALATTPNANATIGSYGITQGTLAANSNYLISSFVNGTLTVTVH